LNSASCWNSFNNLAIFIF